MVKPYQSKPLGLPAKVAGPLVGLSMPSVYRRIREGSLPLLTIGGHKRVSVAGLEAMIGRLLTLDEINAAVRVVLEQDPKGLTRGGV